MYIIFNVFHDIYKKEWNIFSFSFFVCLCFFNGWYAIIPFKCLCDKNLTKSNQCCHIFVHKSQVFLECSVAYQGVFSTTQCCEDAEKIKKNFCVAHSEENVVPALVKIA